MRREVADLLLRWARPSASLSPAEWLEKFVIIPPGYPSSDPGPYSLARFPFWREVVNHAAVPEKLEVIVWKCSQSGGTENVLQGALRWLCANRPAPFLWVSAQVDALQFFFGKRVVPSLTTCGDWAATFGKWRTVGTHWRAANGASVLGVWSSSRAGVKSNSFSAVFADEVSTYGAEVMEKLRPRVNQYPTGKIFALSAVDSRTTVNADADPIIVEWRLTDRREWTMPDPGGGGAFSFRLGWRGQGAGGLRWSPDARREDGTWDLERVAATAHYRCPSGAIIVEAGRAAAIDSGRWVPTAPGRPGAVGYRVPAFLLRQKTFADLAVGFLRSKAAGKDALRTFVLEELAEEWEEEKIAVGESALDERKADYVTGEMPSEAEGTAAAWAAAETRVLVSGDVQKLSLYWLAREWIVKKSGGKPGDSGLVAWEEVAGWEEFEEKTRLVEARASLIDLRYKWRRGEVLSYALRYPHIIPCLGADHRLKGMIRSSVIDAGEGKTGGGRRKNAVGVLTFDGQQLKWTLFGLMQGRFGYPAWNLPRDISREYMRQVTAEEFREGKLVEIRADNHLLDCETMNLVGAIWFGWLSPFGANFRAENSAAEKR